MESEGDPIAAPLTTSPIPIAPPSLAHPQFFILVKGLPGSGKSTLAAAVAAALRCPLADKDDARDAMQAVAPTSLAGAAIDWNALSYEVLFRVAGRQLGLGLSCVLDCPLARRELYDRAFALAERHGATVVLVDVVCGDPGVWRARLEARGSADRGSERAHKPGDWGELQALLERYGGCWLWSADGSTPVPHRLVVDTAVGGTGEAVRAVLGYLRGLRQQASA